MREILPDEDPAEIEQPRQPARHAQCQQPRQPLPGTDAGRALLAPGADQQRTAHQQRLLQNQHGHGRHHKAAIALGGVEQGHGLGVHGRAAHGRLRRALPTGLQTLDLHAGRDGAESLGKTVLHLLADQGIGAVGVDRNHHIRAAQHIALEIARQQRIAHDLAAQHGRARFAFIGRDQLRMDARAGLGKAQHLPGQARVVLHDHGHGHALHHFGTVEPGVEKAVEHGRPQQQQDRALVAQHRHQAVQPQAQKTGLGVHGSAPSPFVGPPQAAQQAGRGQRQQYQRRQQQSADHGQGLGHGRAHLPLLHLQPRVMRIRHGQGPAARAARHGQ